jgi:hypothetical protein
MFTKAIGFIRSTIGSNPESVMESEIVAGQTPQEQYNTIMTAFQNIANTGRSQNTRETLQAFNNLPIAKSQDDVTELIGLILKLNTQLRQINVQRVKTDDELIDIFIEKLDSHLQDIATMVDEHTTFLAFITAFQFKTVKNKHAREASSNNLFKNITINQLRNPKRGYDEISSSKLSSVKVDANVNKSNFRPSQCWNCSDIKMNVANDHKGSECHALFCRNCINAGKQGIFKSLTDSGYHHFSKCIHRPNSKFSKSSTGQFRVRNFQVTNEAEAQAADFFGEMFDEVNSCEEEN